MRHDSRWRDVGAIAFGFVGAPVLAASLIFAIFAADTQAAFWAWPMIFAVWIIGYGAHWLIDRRRSRPSERVATSGRRADALRTLWVTSVIGTLLFAIAFPLYRGVGMRANIFQAEADTRSIATAIRMYAEHCRGLPWGEVGTACPTRSVPGGPFRVPGVLTLEQTNDRGERAGPFEAPAPRRLPPRGGFRGVGESYAYFIRPDGRYLVCAYSNQWRWTAAAPEPSLDGDTCR